MAVYVSGLGNVNKILLYKPILDDYGIKYVSTGTVIGFDGTKVHLVSYSDIKTGLRQIAASYVIRSRAEFKEFKEFFLDRVGGLKKFWLPLWKKEFQLSRDVNAQDGAVYIKNVGLAYKEDPYLRVFIATKNDIIVRRVTQVTIIDAEEERIDLDSVIPVPIKMGEEFAFSRLLLVRFNGEFEVNFIRADKEEFLGFISLRLVELPYEYEEVEE